MGYFNVVQATAVTDIISDNGDSDLARQGLASASFRAFNNDYIMIVGTLSPHQWKRAKLMMTWAFVERKYLCVNDLLCSHGTLKHKDD